jgi:hypothetical protein
MVSKINQRKSYNLLARERTTALLAGPNPKKRKLNQISNKRSDVKSMEEEEVKLDLENKKLKETIASYQAQVALFTHANLSLQAKVDNPLDI